jgi:sulfite exporter TauE/SafE
LTLSIVAIAALREAYRAWRPRPRELVTLGKRPKRSLAFITSLLPRRGLALGIATGFLPCGMLLSAWLIAAATRNPAGGALVMVVFAAASAPALLITALGARRLGALSPRMRAAAWLVLAFVVMLRPLLAAAHHH